MASLKKTDGRQMTCRCRSSVERGYFFAYDCFVKTSEDFPAPSLEVDPFHEHLIPIDQLNVTDWVFGIPSHAKKCMK